MASLNHLTVHFLPTLSLYHHPSPPLYRVHLLFFSRLIRYNNKLSYLCGVWNVNYFISTARLIHIQYIYTSIVRVEDNASNSWLRDRGQWRDTRPVSKSLEVGTCTPAALPCDLSNKPRVIAGRDTIPLPRLTVSELSYWHYLYYSLPTTVLSIVTIKMFQQFYFIISNTSLSK